MIGIYKFTNKITGLSYIGQSIQLSNRYEKHLIEAKSDRRQSKWYKALREFGIENFDYNIIEECQPAELNMREIYWIAYYDSYKNGYNSTPGGQEKYYDPQPIYDAWDEGLAPLEIAQKLGIGTSCIYYNLKDYKNYNKHEAKIRGGRLAYETQMRNNNINPINNYIYQYDLDGNFIKEWNSCKEIQRALKYNASLIGKCVNGKRLSAYNFQWKNYYKESIPPYLNKRGKPRPVIQYDDNWKEIAKYKTIKEASDKTHTDESLIRRVCKNGNKASGYHWKYEDEI